MKKEKMEAKKKMLKELSKMMRDDYYDEPMKGMKKVTVASDTEEGLEKGLSKAEEILKKRKDMEEDEDEFSKGGMKKKQKYT